jgi:hypothetical protein
MRSSTSARPNRGRRWDSTTSRGRPDGSRPCRDPFP